MYIPNFSNKAIENRQNHLFYGAKRKMNQKFTKPVRRKSSVIMNEQN